MSTVQGFYLYTGHSIRDCSIGIAALRKSMLFAFIPVPVHCSPDIRYRYCSPNELSVLVLSAFEYPVNFYGVYTGIKHLYKVYNR